MERLPLYILAGGRSSRFGSDKARALLDGTSLIVRIADALQPVASRVVVVADHSAKYSDLGLHTIADQSEFVGPMRGLHTALTHNRDQAVILRDSQDWLLLCSCDLVDVHPDFVHQLMEARNRESTAVAFRNDAGCWEPLFALYHRSLLDVINSSAAAALPSLSQLLDLQFATSVHLPAGFPLLRQINTRDQLEQTLRRKHGRARCPR